MRLTAIALLLVLAGCGDFSKATKMLTEHCAQKNGTLAVEVGIGITGEYGSFKCTYPPGTK